MKKRKSNNPRLTRSREKLYVCKTPEVQPFRAPHRKNFVQDIPRFPYTYEILYRDTGRVACFVTLEDALRAHTHAHMQNPKGFAEIFTEQSTLLKTPEGVIVYDKKPLLHIRNSLGAAVALPLIKKVLALLDDLEPPSRYRSSLSNRDDQATNHLVRKKGSGNKLKISYSKTRKRFSGWFGSYHFSPEIGRRMYRRPKTQHEITKVEGVMSEYPEWELVRGARRNLPTAWSDVTRKTFDKEASWKHHSKRAKQWKPK